MGMYSSKLGKKISIVKTRIGIKQGEYTEQECKIMKNAWLDADTAKIIDTAKNIFCGEVIEISKNNNDIKKTNDDLS